MTAPSRLGYVTATSSGAVAATVDLSAIPNGSWMVALFTTLVATGTPPAGWTMLCADQPHGTRTFRFAGKIKDATDTSVSWNTASGYKRLTVLWGAGGDAVATWVRGDIGVRAAGNIVAGQSVQAGTSTTSIAPAVTTTKAESLVLSLFSEATTAVGGPASITAGGSTLWFNVGDEAAVIEQHSASYLLPGVGAVVAQTATYSQVQASNGLGVQLIIPAGAAPDLRGPGFPVYKGNKTQAKLYRVTDSVSLQNLAQNPNIELNTNGWNSNDVNIAPIARSTTTPISGTASILTTRAATNPNSVASTLWASGTIVNALNQTPVTPGVPITCSVDVKPELADRRAQITMYWRTAANGANAQSYSPVFQLTAGQATRVSYTATPPAGSAFAYFSFGGLTGAGNAITGEKFWWDNLRISLDGDTTYFDGSYSPDPTLTPSWSGTPHASASNLTGAILRTPVDVAMVNTGYGTYDNMVNNEFYWAHRGGSASFPEHSMHAYTQSILRGYQALEISLNRTSDGVWFGLHDQNLDRTSKVTTGIVDANQMTWAQVQTYQNSIGPGAAQPYMKWDDLIAVYGKTHIMICDLKYRTDKQTEFLDKCKSDIGTDRCIVKGFYDMVNYRAAAQSRGLKTWGYSYQVNIDSDANWATKANGWDLQGMEYGVAQSYWDQVLAFNVPVVAHICPNEAAVTAARNKGAAGYQCSGTAVINPFPTIG